MWDWLFGSGRSLEDTKYCDKLIVTVNGQDVVVDEHVYSHFHHARAEYERRAEFDAHGLSDAERYRRVSEQHKEDSENTSGSKDWAARQRYLQHVAEVIGSAIAGA